MATDLDPPHHNKTTCGLRTNIVPLVPTLNVEKDNVSQKRFPSQVTCSADQC